MTKDGISGRQVLVTGATGMLGSSLVAELAASKANVVALVRDEPSGSPLIASGGLTRINVVRGEVDDLRLVQRTIAEYEIDVVFHLAAQTQVGIADRDPFGTLEANVRGTYSLLEAIRVISPSIPTVIASSDKAYGGSDALPYLESHPLMGRGIYDASKSAADLISAAYATTFNMPLAIARCGNIYGPGDLNWQRIVPGVIRALLRGEPPVIRSDGTPRRDYLYVQDAARAYMILASSLVSGHSRGEAFNFGHGEPVSVLGIVERLQAIIGRPDLAPRILGSATEEIQEQYLDSSKARAQLGWEPKVSLDDGLASTVAWYRSILA